MSLMLVFVTGILDKEELTKFIYGNHRARKASHAERQKEDQEWLIDDMKMASDFEEEIRAPMPHRPQRRRRKLPQEKPTWQLKQEGALTLPKLNRKKRYGQHTTRRRVHQHRRLKLHQRKQKDRDRKLPKIKRAEPIFEMVLPRLK